MDAAVWKRLALPELTPLVRAAADVRPGDVAAIARLRRIEPDPELVRAALLLAEARRKAAPKFGPETAARMWADPDGVEMATSAAAAGYKAARMAKVLGAQARVLDLCCGVGGDAMALAAAGPAVTPVDLDPARAWMAGVNAGVAGVCAEAEAAAAETSCDAVHIDPARRVEWEASGESRRVWRLEDTRPDPAAVGRILARIPDGAVKLSPAVDAGQIPDAWRAAGGELEYLSERGRLTQAVWWAGRLAPPRRTATAIDPSGAHSVDGAPGLDIPVGPVGAVVIEPDPAIERAGLLGHACGAWGAAMLHPLAGVMTADAPPGGVPRALATAFEAVEELAWSPRRVKGRLAEHGAGIVEVKTRGKVVDPDAVQLELRGEGERALTVFVLRIGREVRAIIARRL